MTKNKIVLMLASTLFVVGCSSTELQEYVDSALDGNDVAQTTTIEDDSEAQLAVDRHNEIRAELFSGSALTWSDQIAADAQSYANTLAVSGAFEHDPGDYENGPYGENLYAYYSSNGTIPSLTAAVNNWYVEKDFYNYADNSCSVNETSTQTVDGTEYNTCGHYTQIIWKDTTYIGCARAQYQAGSLQGGYVIVCKYKTPGNVYVNGVLQQPY